MLFPRVWVEEPRKSETMSDTKCHLYRSRRLRLYDVLDARAQLRLAVKTPGGNPPIFTTPLV